MLHSILVNPHSTFGKLIGLCLYCDAEARYVLNLTISVNLKGVLFVLQTFHSDKKPGQGERDCLRELLGPKISCLTVPPSLVGAKGKLLAHS